MFFEMGSLGGCLTGVMFLAFMSITHAAIATAGTSLILSTADPLALGLAILGGDI